MPAPLLAFRFQRLAIGFFLLIIFYLLFVTAVYAETADGVNSFETCKGEIKTWDKIDAELKVAEYTGALDHSNTEYRAYFDLYNRANCPATTITPTPAGNKGIGSSGAILSKDNYNYLLHGQTSIEGSVGHTVFCSLAGYSPLGQCIGYTGAEKALKFLKSDKAPEPAKPMVYNRLSNGGAFGGLAMVTSSMYSNPPTSSVYYLAKLGNQFGVVPDTAYAKVQGSGESIIQPVEKLWEIARNMVYLFFVLVFMIIGVMIMFRKRISQNAVVTVQQALPNLVVGLILVYFSYFIAALCVDIAFFGVQLVAQFFLLAHQSGAHNTIPDIQNAAANSSIFELFIGVGLGNIGTIFSAAHDQFTTSLGAGGAFAYPALAGMVIGAFMGLGLPGAVIGGLGGLGAQFIIPVILILIVLTALFIQVFRLTLSLIMAYIQILVMTVAGPFFILMGAIPGQSGKVTFWVKSLVANALIFPAVFAAVLFAGMILGDTTRITNALPLMGGAGGVNSDLIKVLIAYGIVMGSPAIPDLIRKQFKVSMDPALTNEAMGMFKTSQGLVVNNLGGGVWRGAQGAAAQGWRSSPVGSWRKDLSTRIYQRNAGDKSFTAKYGTSAGPVPGDRA